MPSGVSIGLFAVRSIVRSHLRLSRKRAHKEVFAVEDVAVAAEALVSSRRLSARGTVSSLAAGRWICGDRARRTDRSHERGRQGRELEALMLCKSQERDTKHAIRVFSRDGSAAKNLWLVLSWVKFRQFARFDSGDLKKSDAQLTQMLESASSSSTPFNPANRLITPGDIRAMLARYGLDDVDLQECGLYYKAMVHRSYVTRKNENFVSGNVQCPRNCLPLQEESNERLELLGDAVLSMVVAEYLFERFPEENEGFLTRLRSKIVNGNMLADLSLKLSLDKFVIISRQIEDNNGRRNKKILEDVFEALLGAMYLSLGAYDTFRQWFITFLEDNVDVSQLVLTQNNHKDTLIKYFQHNFNSQPLFVDVSSSSGKERDSRESREKASVVIKSASNVVIGTGSGSTRRIAEEEAAKAALRYYGIAVHE
jgi:ribonuclease-3